MGPTGNAGGPPNPLDDRCVGGAGHGSCKRYKRFLTDQLVGLLDEPRVVSADQIEASTATTLETNPPDATHQSSPPSESGGCGDSSDRFRTNGIRGYCRKAHYLGRDPLWCQTRSRSSQVAFVRFDQTVGVYWSCSEATKAVAFSKACVPNVIQRSIYANVSSSPRAHPHHAPRRNRRAGGPRARRTHRPGNCPPTPAT